MNRCASGLIRLGQDFTKVPALANESVLYALDALALKREPNALHARRERQPPLLGEVVVGDASATAILVARGLGVDAVIVRIGIDAHFT